MFSCKEALAGTAFTYVLGGLHLVLTSYPLDSFVASNPADGTWLSAADVIAQF